MKLIKGSTRIVFVFDSFVIKVPNFTYSWQNFIAGILANIRENTTWKYNTKPFKGQDHLLCPVLFCSWGGWILKMKKVDRILTLEEYHQLESTSLRDHIKHFPGDDSYHNYGYIADRIVKIDYAKS